MGFMTNLFGGGGNIFFTAVFSLGVVMVLIALSAWALKFVTKDAGPAVRGRNRRLTLIETLQVDQKRQVIIFRRDNVEHLVLTGGPQDVVLETGIPVEKTTVTRPAAVPVHTTGTAVQPANGIETAPEHTTQSAAAEAARTAADRLREFTRPLGKRAYKSLRHTGLMRQPGRSEVIPGYLDGVPRDSAKTAPLVEKTKGGDASYVREGAKASRN